MRKALSQKAIGHVFLIKAQKTDKCGCGQLEGPPCQGAPPSSRDYSLSTAIRANGRRYGRFSAGVKRFWWLQTTLPIEANSGWLLSGKLASGLRTANLRGASLEGVKKMRMTREKKWMRRLDKEKLINREWSPEKNPRIATVGNNHNIAIEKIVGYDWRRNLPLLFINWLSNYEIDWYCIMFTPAVYPYTR